MNDDTIKATIFWVSAAQLILFLNIAATCGCIQKLFNYEA